MHSNLCLLALTSVQKCVMFITKGIMFVLKYIIYYVRLLIKRLKEAGVVFMDQYIKLVTLLCNTIYLPFDMMIDATNFIRDDAKSGDLDHKAVDVACDYWIKCINATQRFHKR